MYSNVVIQHIAYKDLFTLLSWVTRNFKKLTTNILYNKVNIAMALVRFCHIGAPG